MVIIILFLFHKGHALHVYHSQIVLLVMGDLFLLVHHVIHVAMKIFTIILLSQSVFLAFKIANYVYLEILVLNAILKQFGILQHKIVNLNAMMANIGMLQH